MKPDSKQKTVRRSKESAQAGLSKPQIDAKLDEIGARQEAQPIMSTLYRQASAQLANERKSPGASHASRSPAGGPGRLLHELEVHQVELELQNAELTETRDRLESLLEKYTDLYDFAPVGYFSLDEQGLILEVNLAGAALMGWERSRIINLPLSRFVVPASQAVFRDFLQGVFAGNAKPTCEVALQIGPAAPFWTSLHGLLSLSTSAPRKWCRVAAADISSIKLGEDAQRRVEVLAAANLKLEAEITRRQAAEETLRKNERQQLDLLEEARLMQEELRELSQQVLHAHEEERKRISRELHDAVAQTLTGINVRLAALKLDANLDPGTLNRNITNTQLLVSEAVDTVHDFARELRPAVLDDLGLIPALRSFLKRFIAQTGIQVRLTAVATVEQLDEARRTVLYRVAQEALINVEKHAGAHLVEIDIRQHSGSVRLEIRDDGKSFPVEQVRHRQKEKRLGLIGMRERLEMVGGKLTIQSAPGRGTTVSAEVPGMPPPRKTKKRTRDEKNVAMSTTARA